MLFPLLQLLQNLLEIRPQLPALIEAQRHNIPDDGIAIFRQRDAIFIVPHGIYYL